MRVSRSTTLLLALLLANACAVLFFRFFITVDGPTHVLHASLLDAPWATTAHAAHGITYDDALLHWRLGDWVLSALLSTLPPEQAHDSFAAIVSCAVVLAAAAFLRAHGTGIGTPILWLAPLTLSFGLVMGLFHFLLGTAVGFGTVAWWKWKEPAPKARWIGLFAGFLLAWWTHRSAALFLSILFLIMFLSEQAEAPRADLNRRRYSLLSMAALAGTLIIGALALTRLVKWIPPPVPHGVPSFNEALLLRPLHLLDMERDRWVVRVIGLLLLLSSCVAAWSRSRLGRRWHAHDAAWVIFLFFQAIAWLGNTPHGRQLLIAERFQWLALVVLVLWIAVISHAHGGRIAKLLGLLALLALPLHAFRIVQLEGSLHSLKRTHDLALQAAAALDPGSLVLPVNSGSQPMLQHLDAYVAMRHSGILLAANAGISIQGISVQRDRRLNGLAHDPHWLMRHWRDGLPAEVDHVLFIGDGIERLATRYPWRALLSHGWRIEFDNCRTRTYSAVRNTVP